MRKSALRLGEVQSQGKAYGQEQHVSAGRRGLGGVENGNEGLCGVDGEEKQKGENRKGVTQRYFEEAEESEGTLMSRVT